MKWLPRSGCAKEQVKLWDCARHNSRDSCGRRPFFLQEVCSVAVLVLGRGRRGNSGRSLSGNALFLVDKGWALPILPSSDIPSLCSSGSSVRTSLYSATCVGLAVACSLELAFFFFLSKSVYTIHLCIVYFNIPSVHLCIIAPQKAHSFKVFPNKIITLYSGNTGKKPAIRGKESIII